MFRLTARHDSYRPPRPLLVALVALITLPVLPMAARADTAPTAIPLSGTPVLIRGGAGNQTDPHISGTLVSYTNIDSTLSKIHYHDLATSQDAAIPTDGQRDSLSDVSGATVVLRRVYTDGSTTTRPIMAFDTANPVAVPVELDPTTDARRQRAAIGGRTVTWEEQVGASSSMTDIVAFDLDTNQTTRLSADGSNMSNRLVAVSPDGAVVAWSKCLITGLSCDIFVARQSADGTWEAAVQLSDGAGEDVQPATNGTVVAYASNAGGDYDIWWENADGTGQRQLAMPGTQLSPNLAGNLISFQSEDVGTTNADLFIYDLATERLYQITNTPNVDESLNDVSIDADGMVWVVWAQPDGLSLGHNDIYAMVLQLSDGAYEICPHFDQSRSYRLKSTVPIRLQLCDADGQNRSSPSLVVTATELVKQDGSSSPAVVEDAGNANPDDDFRYDASVGGTGGYAYNLKTSGLSAGTWELRFTVGGDPATYSVTFDLR